MLAKVYHVQILYDSGNRSKNCVRQVCYQWTYAIFEHIQNGEHPRYDGANQTAVAEGFRDTFANAGIAQQLRETFGEGSSDSVGDCAVVEQLVKAHEAFPDPLEGAGFQSGQT